MKQTISNRLTQEREKKSLTQAQVSEYFIIKPSTYASYEEGRREPPLSFLLSASRFFGFKSVDDFLLGVNRNESNEKEDIYHRYMVAPKKIKDAIHSLLFHKK